MGAYVTVSKVLRRVTVHPWRPELARSGSVLFDAQATYTVGRSQVEDIVFWMHACHSLSAYAMHVQLPRNSLMKECLTLAYRIITKHIVYLYVKVALPLVV